MLGISVLQEMLALDDQSALDGLTLFRARSARNPVG
jgi:hypothetical protein